MPYVNDPSEKALLPEIKQAEELFDEPRDYHEFFYDDQPVPGSNFAGMPEGLYTQVCRFNGRGEHVIMAQNCPHFDQDDEEGKKVAQGWTAQVR